jgi:hypothetical protein
MELQIRDMERNLVLSNIVELLDQASLETQLSLKSSNSLC